MAFEKAPTPQRVIYITNDPNRFTNGDAQAPLVGLKVGEIGYWPIYSQATADALNHLPLTEEEKEAAITCSMFGWHKSKLTQPIHDWLARRFPEDN